MFLKLLKHDLNYSKNTFLTMILITLGVGLAMALIRFFDAEFSLFGVDSDLVEFLGALFMGFGILAITIIMVMQIAQFYSKNFFSDAGYLTLTLPIKRSKLLASKILVSLFWFNLMVLAIIVFIWLLGYNQDDIWSNTFGSWFGFASVLTIAVQINFAVLLAYSLFFFGLTLGNSVVLSKAVNVVASLIAVGVLFVVLVYGSNLLDRFLHHSGPSSYGHNMPIRLSWANIIIAERTVAWQMYIPGFGWNPPPQTVYFPWFMLLLIAITAAIFFFITNHLLNRKISLK